MITIYKFYISRDEELDAKAISRILQKFSFEVAPKLKQYKGYYDGTGQAILSRKLGDPSKPNNRIVVNYCKGIVDNLQGYITGNPITYAAKDDSDISLLLDINEENDVINSDSTFLRHALIYGVAYQLCYVNEKNERRFKNIDSSCVIPIYADDLDEELLYCIYFTPSFSWRDESENGYRVDVYTKENIHHYKSNQDFSSLTISAPLEEHYFGEVPFVVFDLNEDNHSIFDCVITLQDGYNKLISDEINDFEAFVDAYMVLKNVSATAEDLAAMKESRTILLDAEDDVSYLTKSISDTQIENLLDRLNTSIHKTSNSPDFNSTEFNNGVSSGIALQYKLVGFNNVASNVEPQFVKALQKRIELLNKIFTLVETEEMNVDIIITHNLAVNVDEKVNQVNMLRGMVSDETLLAQLPFIDDVEQELQRVEEQNARLTDLYSFEAHTHAEQETDTLEGE